MTTSTTASISPPFDSYLLEVADAVNTTLDLNTLLQRVSSGFNVMTPSIPRAELSQPSVTTPAIDEMIAEGVLFRD